MPPRTLTLVMAPSCPTTAPHGTWPAAASVAPSGQKQKQGRGARQSWQTLSRKYMVSNWLRHPEDKLDEGVAKGMYFLATDAPCTGGILLYTPLWISASLHHAFLISTPLWISASLLWEGQGIGGGGGRLLHFCRCNHCGLTGVLVTVCSFKSGEGGRDLIVNRVVHVYGEAPQEVSNYLTK
jgi:hypothetical protein